MTSSTQSLSNSMIDKGFFYCYTCLYNSEHCIKFGGTNRRKLLFNAIKMIRNSIESGTIINGPKIYLIDGENSENFISKIMAKLNAINIHSIESAIEIAYKYNYKILNVIKETLLETENFHSINGLFLPGIKLEENTFLEKEKDKHRSCAIC